MPRKKRLFIGLISGSMLLIIGLGLFLLYLAANLDSLLNQILLVAIGTVLLLALFAVAFGIAGIVLTLWSVRSFPPLQGLTRMAINLMFPLAIYLGKLLGIEKSVIEGSFVEVNNQMVLAIKRKTAPNKVLLLAPHCLQQTKCPHKITIQVQNCKRCGLCSISSLNELSEKMGVKFAVATGGTFARRFVEEYRPHAIVAIACERDLVSGIMDTNPIPVLGVLNQRPEGPCTNTQVDIQKVQLAVSHFTGSALKKMDAEDELLLPTGTKREEINAIF